MALCSITYPQAISWLDYCNVLYTGLTIEDIWKLQLVENAVAQTVLEALKVVHVTLLLCIGCQFLLGPLQGVGYYL